MKCPADGATPVRQISLLSQTYAPTSSVDDYFMGVPKSCNSVQMMGVHLLSTVSYGTGAFAKDAVVRYKMFHPIDVLLGGGGRLRLHRFACQPVGVRCPTCSS